MEGKNMGFGTMAIHGGKEGVYPYGALTVPIYQTSTFEFESCAQGGDRFAGKAAGHIYSRIGNPTTDLLERKVAALENGEAAIAMASGMGAISSVIWTICKAGAHVVADETLYGCTHALLAHGLTRYGVEVDFIDTSDIEAVKAALKPNTALVYLETPANPNLKIADIKAVADVVHGYNAAIKLVADNTFATPYLQKPLDLGCDVVVHSATKYLNGHGDVIAGMAVGKADFMTEVRGFGLKDMTGAVLGPQEAFLILRGLKTMEIRMERHCANAKKVAEWLAANPKVEKVYYPGLASHPGHEIAAKQMTDFGGMLSFEVKGGKAAGVQLCDNLELCTLAVSLGDAETLVEHPASMTHSPYTPEELEAAGIPEGMVRMSVGLENVEDIIADLERGFTFVK
ncbi:MAG: methionine gamma-lyase [Lachnospiraceae bacterium]|nr:methionine gamma-lyase [Lachnospiraceae bacterium]